jgi:3',5'-cyclic AMP phosphodiesterase CpdA
MTEKLNIDQLFILSDLHIEPEHNEKNETCFRNVLRHANSTSKKSAVVILGDLVDDGTKAAAWKALDKMLKPLKDAGIPIFAAPGNHDSGVLGMGFYKVGWNAYARRFFNQDRVFFGGELTGKLAEPWNSLQAIQLNQNFALAIMSSVPRDQAYFACGEIGSNQLFQLRKLLEFYASPKANSPFKQKIGLVLHHHIFNENPFEALVDAERLKRVINDYGHIVEFLAFGHKHVASLYRIAGVSKEKRIFDIPVYAEPKTPDAGWYHLINLGIFPHKIEIINWQGEDVWRKEVSENV